MSASDSDNSNLSENDLQRKILELKQEREVLKREVELLNPYFVVDKKECTKRRILIALCKKEWTARFGFMKDIFQKPVIDDLIHVSSHLKQITYDEIISFIDGVAFSFMGEEDEVINQKVKPYTDKLIGYYTSEHYLKNKLDLFGVEESKALINIESCGSFIELMLSRSLMAEYASQNKVLIKNNNTIDRIKGDIVRFKTLVHNKTIADFKTDIARKHWIKEMVFKAQVQIKDINFSKISEYSEDKLKYFKNKIHNVFERLSKSESPFSSWANNPVNIKNIGQYIEDNILNIQGYYAKEDVELFAECYFEWKKLIKLLKQEESKLESRLDSILEMFNSDLKQQTSSSIQKMYDLGFSDEKKWNKAEFCAVCYHIFNSYNVQRLRYFNTARFSFPELKENLANYFGRSNPTHSYSRSKSELLKLDKSKLTQISKIFV